MEKQTDVIEQSKKKEKKWARRIWGALPGFFLIALIIIIGLLFARIKAEKQVLEMEKTANLRRTKPDVNVVVLEVTPMPIRDKIDLPGDIQAWIKLTVMTEVRGKVIKKGIVSGQQVKKGKILAGLDARGDENALKSSRASYTAARATLKRLQKLYKSQLASRSQMDEAVAQVENLKAAVDNAALNVERSTIRAPISGVVNKVYVEEGQYLNTADPVAEILQMDRVKVRVGIPESDVDAIRKLTDFTVHIDALSGKTFQAQKHFLSNTAGDLARLYDLELIIINTDGDILPGMFARVNIVKNEVSAGLSVPLYAVITQNNTHTVYVVNEDHARQRQVELGIQEGSRVQITNGLHVGEKVIVMGQRSVNEGDKVNVVREVRHLEDISK